MTVRLRPSNTRAAAAKSRPRSRRTLSRFLGSKLSPHPPPLCSYTYIHVGHSTRQTVLHTPASPTLRDSLCTGAALLMSDLAALPPAILASAKHVRGRDFCDFPRPHALSPRLDSWHPKPIEKREDHPWPPLYVPIPLRRRGATRSARRNGRCASILPPPIAWSRIMAGTI